MVMSIMRRRIIDPFCQRDHAQRVDAGETTNKHDKTLL